jgi:class 3 adenylate cyclase/tetratricopeptide (TPR) repeat protein
MHRCANCGYSSADAFNFCKQCGAAAPVATPGAQRKRVTVLFSDVIASTALGERVDPETVSRVLARYFETGRSVIERHGGTVEKFIGDAVMAVFGVPVLHEDDAWRAARAAIALREEMALLNEELASEYGIRLALRIGVNTGEVVTGRDERLAVGDAVNLAARLEQAAAPDEILLGAETLALVRHSVVAEPLAPLPVKGKFAPVTAWRLVAVHGETARDRRLDVPMVGRQGELRRLAGTFKQTLDDRRCALVTILGAAGVGKSRLAHEFLASLDGAGVVRGRCVSYGEGITYWPVVQVVRQLEPRFPELSLDANVLATLRGLLGPGETTDSTEEIAFAVRKVLEAAARQLPLVCVLDDIQWGEPAFLELIEQVAALSRDAPLLLCCIARLELLERHPSWGGGDLNATTVALEGLSRDETATLIERVSADSPLPTDLRDRIREAAEGNPLFVEEMIGLLRDAPEGDVSVPPTIHALLTARLDQLDPAERAVLQCGAVEGRVFHRGAVQMLAPDERQVGARLAALVRKELIRPDRSQLGGEDAYRFRHLLIRDAAYETLPKEVRAQLHERFADWLEEHVSELVEPDEILGYHVEQACLYRFELRPHDERARGLGLRASRLLAAVGARALERNDVGAALKLLRRALALRPDEDPSVALTIDLTQALFLAGEFAAAVELANEAAGRAAAAGDQAGELRARLAATRIAVQMPRGDAAEEPSAELIALAEKARPVFARARDELGLTEAWVATAWAELIRCRFAAMLEAVEHALEHAHRAGYVRWERELPVWKGSALFYGPTPVDDVLRWYEQEQPQHPMALNERAVLEAMRRRFDEARALLAAAVVQAEEFGETVWGAGGGISAWEVETLAGDSLAAESVARQTCQLLEQLGDTAFRATAAGQLAASLYALGRLDEAEHWTQTAQELASSDDVTSNMLWRQVGAKLLARGAQHDEAARLAREAVGLGEQTDMIHWHANALTDLGEVYVLAGRREEGRTQLEQALALYERKGDLVSAANTRSALVELGQAGALVTERTRQ